MSNIVNKIQELASLLSEEDLDEWMVPKLADHYFSKINSLAIKAYDNNKVAKDAFRERAKAELRSALFTYLFKQEHWRTGRKLNAYLLKTLNRLAERIQWDKDSVKKVNTPLCPACKIFYKREILIPEGKMLRCKECTDEIERLKEDIRKIKDKDFNFALKLEGRLRLVEAFSVHSRNGYKCPDCGRFIPESCNGEFGICCPYMDCMFSGKVESLDKKIHPTGLTKRTDLSLQTPLDNEQKGPNYQDLCIADDINPDVQMEISQELHNEFDILMSVIDQQYESVKRINSSSTMLQKCLMYEAYRNMTYLYPEDMVAYLVHQKQSSDSPIQSRIFQEYVRLMQDALPYTIKKGNEEYDIVSLADPNISLFNGISKFNAIVRSDNTINNNTTETYVGSIKYKCYGVCFLGLIIDINDRRNNNSLKKYIKQYTFKKIFMKDNILPGTPVSVTHYRIYSHYEMGPLVYLQRTRRRIVDKVYFKIHGVKREIAKCA